MTKEPIMIDDIDVSECFHFDKGYKHDNTYCMCDGNMSDICQENPNCYYKQLKRKEQECENNKTAYQMEIDIYNQACLNLQEELKAKEQECEELKKSVRSNKDKRKKAIEKYLKLKEFTNKEFQELKADNEKMNKGYIELTEIVNPYIDDFTGYNEELQGFDIVLCVKELMQQLDALKEELENFKDDCKGCTTCIEAQNNERIYSQSSHKYKQALQEIKDYCNKYPQNSIGFKQQILQKCEVLE